MSGAGRPPAAVPDAGVGPVPVAGRPDTVGDGLVRVTAANPGMMTGPGTNTYLVGSGDLAVVDPGPDDAAHLDAVVSAAAAARGRIRWVLVTHTHPDHAPGAAALAARTGAEQIGHSARDGFVPDRTAGDGFVLEGPAFSLRALATPGHASNHLCWLVEGEGVLLTGDHVMHGSTVVISPPDGDMAQYLASLGRVLDLGPSLRTIAPGHGRLIADPAGTVRAIVAHRLQREEAVARALSAQGPATVDELLPTVYADVDDRLLPVARRSLWAHLRKLAADGRADLVPAPRSGDPPATGPGVAGGTDHPELKAVWRAVAPTAV